MNEPTAFVLGRFRKDLLANGISEDLAETLVRDAFPGLANGESELVVSGE